MSHYLRTRAFDEDVNLNFNIQILIPKSTFYGVKKKLFLLLNFYYPIVHVCGCFACPGKPEGA